VEPYRESIEDFLRRWRSRYEGNRVFRVLVITVVIAACAVTSSGLQQTPIYEASAQVWVDQKPGDQQTYVSGSGEMIKTLPPKGEGLQAIIQPLVYAIDSRPVAEKAVERLGLQREPVGRLGPMGAAELLDKLTVEQVENTSFIVLTYEDTDPVRATRIVNTVGEVSSELISERSRDLTAKLYEKAEVPESPASPKPLRNGLLTLVIGLVFCAGAVVVWPGFSARVAGSLNEWAGRPIVEAELPVDPSEAERTNEQELLEALGRRGKLTAVQASLATSLSVEEANRMLFDLATRGHLEVTVEHGRLVYSFWGEHGA
jgi:capsular polysaccharide biosynthesis protein